MIGRAVQRIPAESRKPIAGGLVLAAGAAACFGLVLTSLGIAGGETVEECTGHLVWKECEKVYNDWSLATSVFIIVAGVGLLIFAAGAVYAAILLSLTRSHLNKYQAILTGVEVMSIQKVADITHVRPSKVRSEIQ